MMKIVSHRRDGAKQDLDDIPPAQVPMLQNSSHSLPCAPDDASNANYYYELEDHSDESQGARTDPLQNRPNNRFWTVSLFATCTVLLFADQNLMAPNLTAIGNEFGFNQQERDKKLGGDIALAFFVLGAPASLVIGLLADSYRHRTRLFAATVCLGEGACLLTYWSTTYLQLYMARAVTGFSLGGAFPLIYSILGDLFAADERHTVSALVGVGTGLGTALGQGIAGFLGPTFGWRLPFLIVSIPAIACAIVVWLTVQEPERGAMEESSSNRDHAQSSSIRRTLIHGDADLVTPFVSLEDNVALEEPKFSLRAHWSAFRSLMATPTVRLALLQGAPGCVPWGIVNTYLNDFLAENRGMTVEYATFNVLLFGCGNFVGMMLGGGGATYLYRIDKRYPALLAGSAAVLGSIPFWVLINFVNASTPGPFAAAVALSAGVMVGITGPIIKAQLQNVTLPRERGQAFALFNTTDDFGRGLGPVFVAALITQLGGRTPAFNVGISGWILCGLLNLGIFFTVVKDEEDAQNRLRQESHGE